MLTSIAIILLSGLFCGWLFLKIKLPGLFGMILIGIVIGPQCMNLIDQSVLNISGDLRQIALVIILTRAGLSLNFSDLKKIGRPALLMSFLPACFEMIGVIIFAPMLLDISLSDAAIIGSVIAAVSPAVIVPRMIKLIEEGYGKDKEIPKLILAGASVDDIFVIVIFSVLTSFSSTGELSTMVLSEIPVSVIVGIISGCIIGLILVKFFKAFHIRDTLKIIIVLSVSFFMLEAEHKLEDFLPMSGLLSIMSMGVIINQKGKTLAKRLSAKYNKMWLCAEIVLFVLVGVAVDVRYAFSSGVLVLVLIIIALAFRMLGVVISLVKTDLNVKEKLFCAIAYIPKATVQAAIGAIPLSMGLPCGDLALVVAVVSILFTAPIGAICIDLLYKKLLSGHSIKLQE